MSVDFDATVLQRSHEVPVLVDFWAPWCGPCRVLGPLLDKLAATSNGAWELCKINTDTESELANRYGIRGIPAVKLFVDGQVTNSFTGVMPEAQLRAWLKKAIPSSLDQRVTEAETAVDAHNTTAAIAILEDVLRQDSHHAPARILLARLVALEDLPRATKLIQSNDVDYSAIAQSIRTLSQFVANTALTEGSARSLMEQVQGSLRRGDIEQALQNIITTLQTDRFYMDDAARKVGVAIFTILGPTHALTHRHRRTFDMWLY